MIDGLDPDQHAELRAVLGRGLTGEEVIVHGADLAADLTAGVSADRALASAGLERRLAAEATRIDDGMLGAPEGILGRAKVLKKLYARMAAKDSAVIELRNEIDPVPSGAGLTLWIESKRCEALGVDDASMIAIAERALNKDLTATVTFPNPDGQQFVVPADSLLGSIAAAVAKLVEEYPWRPSPVLRWLVCGDPVPPVVNFVIRHEVDGFSLMDFGDVQLGEDATSADYKRLRERLRPGTDTRWRVILTLDPALSPAEVAAIYSKVRPQRAPNRYRPLDAKRLALANFVLDQPEDYDVVPARRTTVLPLRPVAEGPTSDVWDRWLGRWNEGPARTAAAEDNWAYDRIGQGRYNFRRDARSALTRLRYAGWHINIADGL